ncbi:XRE family transcriptional regulator [Nocardia panacis]|uniref:XRE family transcriptional regulator n=1 Tax=Nocardia panacis TaxID=2340916 RepID=A0A3A4KW13_9NOCA|nr:helix-turn-helix transcriptional regulator [Nocardia panacis]RJO77674.1 XRE family transcriptional regulator [Nocardia panacis]
MTPLSSVYKSTLLRRHLGIYLRERRDSVRWRSLAVTAVQTSVTQSAIQRLEAGAIQRPCRFKVEALCKFYGLGRSEIKSIVAVVDHARAGSDPVVLDGVSSAHFDLYAQIEERAHRIVGYHDVVPELLRTPQYHRALTAGGPDHDDPAQALARATVEVSARGILLTRGINPVQLDLLLDESVLYRIVGDAAVTAAQLRVVASAVRWPNVTVRLVPHTAGVVAGRVPTPFTLLESCTDAPVVVFSCGAGDLYSDNPRYIEKHRALAIALRATAIGPAETQCILLDAAARLDDRCHSVRVPGTRQWAAEVTPSGTPIHSTASDPTPVHWIPPLSALPSGSMDMTGA